MTARRGLALTALCLLAALSPAPAASSTACPAFNETQYLQQALSALDDIVYELLNETGLPGMAVGVVLGSTTLFAKGYGTREKGTNMLVDTDTVFQMASVSKSLAASALSLTFATPQAVAKQLSWSSRVSKLNPRFKLKTEPANSYTTIADMFAHRSGLPDHAGDLVEDLGFPPESVFTAMRHYNLAPWRDSYAYTNIGLTVGALAAASTLNTTWEQLCQDHLFAPLGMSSSSFTFQNFVNRTNRVTPHVWKFGAKTGPVNPQCEACNGEFDVSPRAQWRDPDGQAPAAGASSSLNDMLKWLKFILAQANTPGTALQDMFYPQNRRTPRPETPEARAHVLPATGPGTNGGPAWYGLGANVGADLFARATFSHSGAFNLGTGTSYTVVPGYGGSGIGIIVLTHGSATGIAESVLQAFYDVLNKGSIQPPIPPESATGWLELLFSAAFKGFFVVNNTLSGLQPPPAASCQPSRPWSAYVARYRSPLYGDFVVTYNGTGLVGYLGPRNKPTMFNLTCWGGDQFSLESIGENAVGRSPVTFLGNITRNRPDTVSIFWLNEAYKPQDAPLLSPFRRLV